MTDGIGAPLGGIVVVELATGVAGPYAGKLYADAGATVFKVEPAGGDPERRRGRPDAPETDRDAPLFRHLNTAKRSVIGLPADALVESLIERADLVVESTDRIDVTRWRDRHPALVVLTITPFGLRGQMRDRPATGFTLQAESGSIGSRGRKDGVPFQAGGRLTEWAGGVFGAVGALAAVMRARESGVGEHVDCSLLASDHLITNGNVCVRHSFLGHPAPDGPARIVDVPSIEPTADGFIGFNTNTRQQYESFVTMVERPELVDDPRWASADYRLTNADEWNAMVRPWLRRRTTADIMQQATKLRIPVAPVNNGELLLHQEQFAFRGSIARYPDGSFEHPQPPYRIDGVRPRITLAAPTLDEHADVAREFASGPVRTPVPRTDDCVAALPFAGLRVLDATSMWAGPIVGQVFAALGADVIHLESIQRLDLARLKVDGASQVDDWWERGHSWFMIDWNKRDLTLDLTSERGRELVEALLPTCDVMVENFAPRVFDRFGLTTDRVLEVNPDIVFVRMPAFGLDGPWRDYIGFAQTMEQMSGLAWLTGHVDDDAPQVPRGPCDPLAGYHAMFAALVALAARRAGRAGMVVEAAMAESALNAAAESVVAFSAHGEVLGRHGNRDQEAAPQGLYRCAGTEQWLALSVVDDAQWQALKHVLGRPEWADDPALDHLAGRLAAHDDIDDAIARWASPNEVDALVRSLAAAGVPAAQVTDPRFADQHAQLNEIGYFEPLEHPVMGVHRAPTLPFRYASVDRWSRTAAARLGEHNREILRDDLGLGDAEIDELERTAVIGNRPLGSNPSFDL